MPRPILGLLLAAAMVAATAWLGWWTLPVLAGAWGLRYAPLDAALAAALSWGGLLAWQAARAPVMVLAERVGGIFSLPSWAMLLLTPLFAALLAWSAAAVAHRLVPRSQPNQGDQ